MTTLLFLLVALSTIPFATLYEKNISYISEKDLTKGNNESHISDTNYTRDWSKTSTKRASTHGTTEKTNDLSQSYKEVGNRSRKVLKAKTANESLTAGNENNEDAVTKASVESLKGGWNAENNIREGKLFI